MAGDDIEINEGVSQDSCVSCPLSPGMAVIASHQSLKQLGSPPMESRLRIAGQAVQPVLVMFPLGLFAMAVLFDLGNLLGGPDILGALAYWNIIAGLVGGVLAAVAAAIDLAFVRPGTPAKRTGVLNTLINMGVLIFFAVILLLRMRTVDRVAGGGLLAVEILALAAAAYGAWFGGELVNRRPVQVATRKIKT
jgi:uncharacterized membrane protein